MAEIKLIITSQGQSTRDLLISATASIGRATDNAICVNDPSVARYHAMVEQRGNDFWLSDLGSANGTHINGRQVHIESQLKNGDVISLGATTKIRVLSNQSEAVKPAPAPPPVSAAAPVPEAPAPPVHAALVAPSPPPSAGISAVHLLAAGFSVLVVIGAVAAFLIMRKGSGNDDLRQVSGYTTPLATATPVTVSSKETVVKETPPLSSNTKTVSLAGDGTEQLTRLLATSITGKSTYVFNPQMTAKIAARTRDYQVDVSKEAMAYRLEIERAFSNAKGMKPLMGYVMAMSQSKFGRSNAGGVGIWQVPPGIAKDYLQPGEDLSSLAQPKRSAEVAAAYLNEILTKFESQDFIYAIACYGLPASSVGEMRQKIQAIDPTERRDFWKMVEKGVIPPEGAERVIRFFAAGIVGENPAVFGLSAKPFSELS